MDKHITLVAALNIGFGFLGFLLGAFFFIAIVGGGMISGDPEAIAITSLVGSLLAGFFVILSIPSIVGGFGLLKRKSWARIVIFIVAVFDLFAFPIGTLLGIYELWVMLEPETAKLLN